MSRSTSNAAFRLIRTMAFCVWRRRRRGFAWPTSRAMPRLRWRLFARLPSAAFARWCLPELNLCGYTAADLFHNRTLLHACEAALVHILDETRELPVVFTVGLPVAVAENIYNCAAVCCAGELLGLTAKKYLPNYGEFYERRWFAPAPADPVWVEFGRSGSGSAGFGAYLPLL